MIKFSTKSEKLFREVTHSLTHYHALRAWPARWGVSQLGTHGFCSLSPLSPSLSLPPLPPRLSLSLSAASRLLGALRFARALKTRLQHRTCKTSRGYFVSHYLDAYGFSTERARLAGGTSLRSCFQKRCLLPAGILIFLLSKKSSILKIQVGLFPP